MESKSQFSLMKDVFWRNGHNFFSNQFYFIFPLHARSPSVQYPLSSQLNSPQFTFSSLFWGFSLAVTPDCLVSAPTVCSSDAEDKKVLVFNSYHDGWEDPRTKSSEFVKENCQGALDSPRVKVVPPARYYLQKNNVLKWLECCDGGHMTGLVRSNKDMVIMVAVWDALHLLLLTNNIYICMVLTFAHFRHEFQSTEYGTRRS